MPAGFYGSLFTLSSLVSRHKFKCGGSWLKNCSSLPHVITPLFEGPCRATVLSSSAGSKSYSGFTMHYVIKESRGGRHPMTHP